MTYFHAKIIAWLCKVFLSINATERCTYINKACPEIKTQLNGTVIKKCTIKVEIKGLKAIENIVRYIDTVSKVMLLL